MKKLSRHGNNGKSAANNDGPLLNIILYSTSDNAHYHFCVPEQMSVDAFLEFALTRLSEEQGAERVEALRRYYEPVLEMQGRDGNIELAGEKSLIEAGVSNQSVCQIAARPRKERIMFCSYSG